ncbi:unnamed protein product [Rangifer tarandus platyrhynchus]|uniref:Uncharacterized protein n=2 Tax=Rangifer tarandus platyrhynchus TaxID=3082113 RepID=A0ABN8Y4G7_RANTA|nr:unnamed protein product [Rangifer tarandus platyrhynchus]CAI9695816.1 unnamed protein product [Rangifer tarandus platyrhynchus]
MQGSLLPGGRPGLSHPGNRSETACVRTMAHTPTPRDSAALVGLVSRSLTRPPWGQLLSPASLELWPRSALQAVLTLSEEDFFQTPKRGSFMGQLHCVPLSEAIEAVKSPEKPVQVALRGLSPATGCFPHSPPARGLRGAVRNPAKETWVTPAAFQGLILARL